MSNSIKNLNEIVSKLHEIDNVFKFGEKMIPVVEGFVSFMTDFIPFVEQISGSIEATRSKIPQASNQIDKVTKDTELAMTEVLDKVDEINLQLGNISEFLAEVLKKRAQAEFASEELKKFVKGNPEAEKILDTVIENIDFSLTLELIKNKIGEITTNVDQITMSLQVQDITAQQLAAVNHLIVSVQHKLGSLLSVVDSSHVENEDVKMEKLPGVHFDANASYSTKDNQDNVDSIINNEKASQEEIDKLFS